MKRLERNKDAQVGEPGYQYHARVPRQARPDYIRVPQSAVVVRAPIALAVTPFEALHPWCFLPLYFCHGDNSMFSTGSTRLHVLYPQVPC